MQQVEIRTFLGDRLLHIVTEPLESGSADFSDRLEHSLVAACRQLNAPLPIWMSRNTREFVQFHQTLFFEDQFMEPTQFDRLQLRLLQE